MWSKNKSLEQAVSPFYKINSKNFRDDSRAFLKSIALETSLHNNNN